MCQPRMPIQTAKIIYFTVKKNYRPQGISIIQFNWEWLTWSIDNYVTTCAKHACKSRQPNYLFHCEKEIHATMHKLSFNWAWLTWSSDNYITTCANNHACQSRQPKSFVPLWMKHKLHTVKFWFPTIQPVSAKWIIKSKRLIIKSTKPHPIYWMKAK